MNDSPLPVGGSGATRTLPRDWGRGGTPRRLNNRAMPQVLDQRTKMK